MSVVVSPRVAAVLLAGGLARYRRVHAGRDPETDLILLRLTLDARRHRLGAAPRSGHSRHGQPDSGDDQLVSTAEAARTSGVHVRTIHRAIHRGALPAQLIGSRWAVRVGDLATYANQRLAPVPPCAPASVDGPRPPVRGRQRAGRDCGDPTGPHPQPEETA